MWSWNSEGIEHTSMNNCFSAPHVDCKYWQFGTRSLKFIYREWEEGQKKKIQIMDYKWVLNHNNRNKLKSEGNCDFLYIFFSWIIELFIKTRQVKTMKQDGCYKDTTEVLGKRKYIRSNPIATKYIMPLWSTSPLISLLFWLIYICIYTTYVKS